MNTQGPDAWLLAQNDDVATAVRALAAGAKVVARCGEVVRTVTLVDAIPAGHKFAVRPLAGGLRIRKYGEFIGRTACAIAAGAWVHDHNLATTARRAPDLERAWADAVPPKSLRVLGRSRLALGESPVWNAREASNRVAGSTIARSPSAIFAAFVNWMLPANARWRWQ